MPVAGFLQISETNCSEPACALFWLKRISVHLCLQRYPARMRCLLGLGWSRRGHGVVAVGGTPIQSGGAQGLPHSPRLEFQGCRQCWSVNGLRRATIKSKSFSRYGASFCEMLARIRWEVTSNQDFAEPSHVSLQEARAGKIWLAHSLHSTSTPLRLANGTDSWVFLGSWAKGRSFSLQLNGLLRTCIG